MTATIESPNYAYPARTKRGPSVVEGSNVSPSLNARAIRPIIEGS